MGTIPAELGDTYRAILEENWEAMAEYYKKHSDQVLFPITARRDTALHMAVYSNKRKPVNDLLDIIKGFTIDVNEDALTTQNALGNTPLHEAATCGNYDAVELLVKDDYPKLLQVKNIYGETALFRATVFGHTNIVEYLAKQAGQMDANNKLLDIHRVRLDSTSILHPAVQGEHFDTALLLLTLDESLGEAMDNRGITALHLLANLPSAFRSGYSNGLLKRFIYFCLPNEDDHDHNDTKADHIPVPLRRGEDLEIGQSRHQDSNLNFRKVMKRIKLSICRFFFEGWPAINRIWDDKRRHGAALRIAKLLIKKDASLNEAAKVGDSSSEIPVVMCNPAIERERVAEREIGSEINEKEETQPSHQATPPAPLLTAASKGIEEIVHEILKQYPQAVEYHNDMGQNILHVAVMHRQKEIFKLVKHKRIPFLRMHHATDQKGCTLLHHVADTKHYTGGTSPGPALQLQEELQWFERVKKIVPSHYVNHCDKDQRKTPKELFDVKHNVQFTEAQKWTKDTLQAGTTLAAMFAAVEFTAIYTETGGSNEKGIHSPYFLFFTVMDATALACSLVSAVMFLSILTSPFQLSDFLHSLPWKLTFGFALLFFSAMAGMLAFGASIALVVHSSTGWITGLIVVAAFLPLPVFLLMPSHLCKVFTVALTDFFKSIKKALPLPGCNRKQH